MATGPAVPGKPQVDVHPEVIGSQVNLHEAKIQEELRKAVPAKSMAQIANDAATVQPTGDEVHAKAQQMDALTKPQLHPVAPDVNAKKVTGKEVVDAVIADKKAASEQAKKDSAGVLAARQKAEEQLKKTEEDRKKADEKAAKEAGELARQHQAKADAEAKQSQDKPVAPKVMVPDKSVDKSDFYAGGGLLDHLPRSIGVFDNNKEK